VLSLTDLYGGRLYVVDKRMESNSVIVAEGTDHPALLADSLYASDVHWISDTPRQLQVSSTPISASHWPSGFIR
jgi:tRNA U34 2-thiouridine synthase MnmA/TrmU